MLRHSVHSGKFEWLARATNLNCSLGSAVVAPSFKPNSSKDNSLRAAVRARNHEPGALLSACFKGGARLYNSISGKYTSLYKASPTNRGCLIVGGVSLGSLSHSSIRSFHHSTASLVEVILAIWSTPTVV